MSDLTVQPATLPTLHVGRWTWMVTWDNCVILDGTLGAEYEREDLLTDMFDRGIEEEAHRLLVLDLVDRHGGLVKPLEFDHEDPELRAMFASIFPSTYLLNTGGGCMVLTIPLGNSCSIGLTCEDWNAGLSAWVVGFYRVTSPDQEENAVFLDIGGITDRESLVQSIEHVVRCCQH